MVRNKLSWLGAFLLLAVLLSVSAFSRHSGAGTSWTVRRSGGFPDLKGVTYGNGTFVAVGWDGTILTSREGVKWTKQFSGTENHLWGVTYGNGTFVAVGWDGTILTSP